MRYLVRLLVIVATSLPLLAASAIAGQVTAPQATTADQAMVKKQPNHLENSFMSEANYLGVRHIYEVRHIFTRKQRRKYRKKKKKAPTIAAIRSAAIKDSLRGLRPLRPYTTSYKRLQSAVRRYWRRNVTRPNGNALARIIMRHVKRGDRSDVRSSVFSGARSGVRKVKRQLAKRRR